MSDQAVAEWGRAFEALARREERTEYTGCPSCQRRIPIRAVCPCRQGEVVQ